jgi:hypothetical protein
MAIRVDGSVLHGAIFLDRADIFYWPHSVR